LGHTVSRPARQSGQTPHGIAAMTCTRSPTDQPATPSPISVISPAISWPIVRGGTM
jgi:hypothetical protein